LRANFHFDLFAVNHQGFGLQIRLPYLFGMALRKAYVIAVLLAFAGNFTLLHNQPPILQMTTDKVNRLGYTK
jgi:hypothetical protein